MSPIKLGPTSPNGAVSARFAAPERIEAAMVPASDAVRISDHAGTFVDTSLAMELGDMPTDAARVSAIRNALESGVYRIDPYKIADAMIAAGMPVWSSEE